MNPCTDTADEWRALTMVPPISVPPPMPVKISIEDRLKALERTVSGLVDLNRHIDAVNKPN